MKRPSRFLYVPLAALVKLIAWMKGQRITTKCAIQGPALVLSNHTSFYDFMYTVSAVFPHRVNFLVAAKYFDDPVLGPFMTTSRSIKKHLFQPDLAAVKKTFKVLNQNGIVGIFPEGQISPIGITYPLDDNIAKLIHKTGVRVYVVKHHNAYFVNPPWSKNTFKGRITTTIEEVLTSEQASQLGVSEIHQLVQQKLDYNAASYLTSHPQTFHMKPIKGLEYVIYRCPHCEKDSLVSLQQSLVCRDCGTSFPVSNRFLVGDFHLDELYNTQYHVLEERIRDSVFYTLTASVHLETIVNKRVRTVGQGILTLDPDHYTYVGTRHDEPVQLQFATKGIPFIPSDIGQNIQIYDQNQLYQFRFDDARLTQPFVMAGEIFYRRHQEVSHESTPSI